MNELEYYLSLPWTLLLEEHDDDGHYYSIAIQELRGFIVAAETDQELAEMFWPALEAYLTSYLAHGETPPSPESSTRPSEAVTQSAGSPATFVGSELDFAGV